MKLGINYHERKELLRLRKENAKLQEMVNRHVAERFTNKIQYRPIDITFDRDVTVTKIDGLTNYPFGSIYIPCGGQLRLNIDRPLLTKP